MCLLGGGPEMLERLIQDPPLWALQDRLPPTTKRLFASGKRFALHLRNLSAGESIEDAQAMHTVANAIEAGEPHRASWIAAHLDTFVREGMPPLLRLWLCRCEGYAREATQTRLRAAAVALDCGLDADLAVFYKNIDGWSLNFKNIKTPWKGRRVPTSPLEAIRDIEVFNEQ